MRWALCLCQGRAISALTPISTGSLEAVMETAAERYRVLLCEQHPDGRMLGGRWVPELAGRYAIVPDKILLLRMPQNVL